jgi:beta-phosphoglucomutase-like phosphatase (HAD superfamily)
MSRAKAGRREQMRALDAVIFDLDGVVAQKADWHATAWERLFDDYLAQRAAKQGEPFRPFDAQADYRRFVDGKPRHEGVRSFLGSRGIGLPYGDPADPHDRETVCGPEGRPLSGAPGAWRRRSVRRIGRLHP